VHLLRDVDGFNHLGVYHGLLAAHQLLQEVDGDVVVRGQIHAHVRGEEVVDLALAAVLGRELLGGDLPLRRWARIDWLHRLISAVHLSFFSK
jgi:hypothetical protein